MDETVRFLNENAPKLNAPLLNALTSHARRTENPSPDRSQLSGLVSRMNLHQITSVQLSEATEEGEKKDVERALKARSTLGECRMALLQLCTDTYTIDPKEAETLLDSHLEQLVKQWYQRER